jgi:hypothetical protein
MMVVVSEDGICGSTVSREGGDLPRPPIVTLCGSTRFKDQFEQAEMILEMRGWAVFTVGGFPHHDKFTITEKEKIGFDILHKQKIAMSDAIYVVNVNGYIGESTRSEIALAKSLGKAIMYLEGDPNAG